MKILVTGGSGFIGSRLVELLVNAGHHVVIYDKAPSEAFPDHVILGDVRDPGALTQAMGGCDAIYHLAAEHKDDVRPLSLYDDVNVGGARSVVAAAKEAGCARIIVASSVALYPLNFGNPTEETTPAPFNPYGQSKLDAEQVFLEYAERHPEIALTMIRPCVIFGENNRGNVYNLLAQIASGRFIMVGAGKNRKSMAYVGNITAFLRETLDREPGVFICNYADKPDLSTGELVSIASRALGRTSWLSKVRIPYPLGMMAGYLFDGAAGISGRTFPLSSIRVRKFCADTTVSTDRLDDTGFKRPYTLAQGLEMTIASEFGK